MTSHRDPALFGDHRGGQAELKSADELATQDNSRLANLAAIQEDHGNLRVAELDLMGTKRDALRRVGR